MRGFFPIDNSDDRWRQSTNLRDVLRKLLVFVGLTILLAGLVLLAFGSARNTKLVLLKDSYKSWEVSGNLASGHTYVMDIQSSQKWRMDIAEGGGL